MATLIITDAGRAEVLASIERLLTAVGESRISLPMDDLTLWRDIADLLKSKVDP